MLSLHKDADGETLKRHCYRLENSPSRAIFRSGFLFKIIIILFEFDGDFHNHGDVIIQKIPGIRLCLFSDEAFSEWNRQVMSSVFVNIEIIVITIIIIVTIIIIILTIISFFIEGLIVQ